MPKRLSLPDGYRARELDGSWYLLDPQGVPFVGPADAAAIEASAWHDVWRRLDHEINDELAAFRAGTRPLRSLRRLGQYMRMLHAVAQTQSDVKDRPAQKEWVRWGALTVSAAAVAAALLVGPLRIGRVPESTTHPSTPTQPAATMAAARPTPPGPARERPGVRRSARPVAATRAAAASSRPARAARSAPRRRTVAAYAVSVGEFVSRATADRLMHLVRSKGYIVYVVPRGEVSQVVTRPYRERGQAERMVNALEEIGFPAQLTTRRAL